MLVEFDVGTKWFVTISSTEREVLSQRVGSQLLP